MDELQKTYFLDMGVIVGYLTHTNRQPRIDDYSTGSTRFLEKNKNEHIISCYSIMENDLKKFIARWKIMVMEIRKKFDEPDYKIQHDDLYPRDIERAKKIYNLKQKIGAVRLNQKLISLESTIEIRLDYLKKNIINDIVMPEKEIDEELRSHFQATTKNYSDSKVLASAVQYTNSKNNDTTIVTTDHKDFGHIKEDLEMREIFENYKAPNVIFIKKQRKVKTGG